MRKILIISMLFCSLIACKGTEEVITVKQMETDLPVIIKLNHKRERISLIQFPIKFRLENSSLKRRIFTSVGYYYNSEFLKNNWGWSRGFLFRVEDHNLMSVAESKWKDINFFSKNEYVLYTAHKIDTTKSLKYLLEPYFKKMILQKQDSLIVGSLKTLKEKHYDFVKELLEKDSLELHLKQIKGKKGKCVDIKMPINW